MGVQPDSGHAPDELNSIINPPRHSPTPRRREISLLHDILSCIGNEEALRLISIYSDELSPIYSYLDVSQAISHIVTKSSQGTTPDIRTTSRAKSTWVRQ